MIKQWLKYNILFCCIKTHQQAVTWENPTGICTFQMLPNANNPDGYSSDRTNLGSKDGEKTDTTSKRNLKTNITKMFV